MLKLSGGLFDSISVDGSVSPEVISAARDLSEFSDRLQIAVTVGGGHLARQYIGSMRALGHPDAKSSPIGGDIGALNAQVFRAALQSHGVRCGRPTENWDRAEADLQGGSIPILCGWWPGLTSDSVAAYFADHCQMGLMVKVSPVGRIFDEDPALSDAAVPLTFLTHRELHTMAAAADSREAGSSFVLDIIAAKRLQSCGLPLVVTSISHLREALEFAVNGDRAVISNATIVGSA